MTTANFTITTDHLDGTRTGQSFPLPYYGDDPSTVRVQLFDDDGIKYYTGTIVAPDELIDECVDRVFEWSMIDSGTTRIDVDGETWIA